jgi:bis(5'-nucleosyl)-tetraphosphatase (symmetrical)
MLGRMSIYAVGDVQGCYDELRRLVDRIRFDPARDQLWLVGDLVNRGPRSLEVLRFVKGLGSAAVSVLGNHDLHLLACAYGARKPKEGDTLDDVLAAPDRDELVAWLAARPFLHRVDDYVLVHAGLHPSWNAATAMSVAADAEAAMRASPQETIATLRRGAVPPLWDTALAGEDRLRAIVAILTRMRICTADGVLDLDFTGPPDQAPHGRRPWFDWPGVWASEVTAVFGHWSALGLRVEPHVIALDTGCVWGRALTAVRIDDGNVYRQPAL